MGPPVGAGEEGGQGEEENTGICAGKKKFHRAARSRREFRFPAERKNSVE